MHTIANPFLWESFAIIVVAMVSADICWQKRLGNNPPPIKKVAMWSLAWIIISLAFCALFWLYLICTQNREVADTQAMSFFTSYLLEKALAADNVFVWLTILNYFSIPPSLQCRLLTWGILGAIGLRGIIVFVGSWIIGELHWLLYVFGLLLLFSGTVLLRPRRQKKDIKNHPLIRWFFRRLRVTEVLHGTRFFIRHNEFLFVTPLLLALIMIEISDVIFSLDSIPAILAVTTDPFVILVSNLFAVLGLRAMYFLLFNISEYFSLLKYALAIILIFIGIKMLIIDVMDISVAVSLSVVLTTLAVTVLLNILVNRASSV